LIQAAYKLKDLVADMENLDNISGFIVYKDEEVRK